MTTTLGRWDINSDTDEVRTFNVEQDSMRQWLFWKEQGKDTVRGQRMADGSRTVYCIGERNICYVPRRAVTILVNGERHV